MVSGLGSIRFRGTFLEDQMTLKNRGPISISYGSLYEI